MKNLITICARGGSKGIPKKNIKLLNNIPLIAYSIELANQFAIDWNADIVLSTDDEEIKNVAEQYGLETKYIRPKFLAQDKTGKIETLKHVIDFCKIENFCDYSYILDLDVTSPLRNLNDLIVAFEILKSNPEAYNLLSVSPANRNPYFNQLEIKENGFYDVVKDGKYFSRQEAPLIYDMNSSFYFYRSTFFENDLTTTTTSKSLIYIVPHKCFDLDHQLDFEFMEYLLTHKKLDFQL
jgi:CMP-N,N'-diacetyllegionaminic acid synthase